MLSALALFLSLLLFTTDAVLLRHTHAYNTTWESRRLLHVQARREALDTGKQGSCLRFQHIPRTGGTSIEDNHLYDMDYQRRVDSGDQAPGDAIWDPIVFGTRSPALLNPRTGRPVLGCGKSPVCKCSHQHVPPSLSHEAGFQQFFSECDTFCVVRDPFDRVLSEFTFQIARGAQKADPNCSSARLDEFVEQLERDMSTDPYAADCHYLPQVVYTHGSLVPDGGPKQPSACKRLLRFENLTAEYNELMAEKGIPTTLQAHLKTYRGQRCSYKFSQKASAIIQRVYAQDFKQFGYKF